MVNNLSIALAKLQAEEELRKSHEQLEQKVAERTVRLRAANVELWEQEECLRSLSDNIHGITYQLVRAKDGELRFDFISAGIEKHYGFPVARAIADAQSVFAKIHPDDAPQLLKASEEAARALRDFDMEARIVTPAGEIRWMQWRSTPRRLKNGDTVSDGIATDITERKETEEALQRANRALLMLKECDAALVRAKTEPELLNKICSILVNIGNNLMAWVGFAEDDEEKTVRPVAQMGGDKEYLKMAMVSWADTPRGCGPAGMAIRKQRVCQCRHTATDPRFSPWREDAVQRGYASVIAVPLLRDNQCLGVIMIYSAQAGGFQKEEVELLERLAKDLAYGIIVLRTRVAHEQLQRELLAISEREKQLISQELHDGLCQNLAGTAMMSRVLQQRLAAREDPDADCAKQICEMLSASVNETRNLSHALHPVGPEGEGLMNALEQLAQTVTNLFHIRCTFRCPESVFIENETVSTHLFRITQEAINNARKHGEADRVTIGLRNTPAGLTLTIRDNGIGIPVKLPKKTGMGLGLMKLRASEIGATLSVRRAGKHGTLVTCTLPCSTA